MPEDSAALARCKPLSDPVRSFANIVLFWIYFGALILAFFVATSSWLAIQKRNGGNSSEGIVLGAGIFAGLIGMIAGPLGFWLLLAPANRAPIVYLRAFRSDRPARRLRSLLKAALGNRFRLCGIRPPHQRSNRLQRFFARRLTALHYIGSEYFELEAEEHNWMARLLATYARCRFVFIDVRDLTQHVEKEVRLSYLAMGVERCVFLIDSTRSQEDWTLAIRTLLQDEAAPEQSFHFVQYPGDESLDAKTFVEATRDVISGLPSGAAVIPDKAIAFAKQQVVPAKWATPFWETDAGQMLLAVSIWSGLIAVSWYSGVDFFAATSVIGFAGVVLFFIAWGRDWKQANLEQRLRRPGTGSPRRRLVFSLLLVLCSPVLVSFGLLGVTVHKIDEHVDVAKTMLVQRDIQAISTHLKLYESMNGFLPTTEQGLQALVTQPTSEPKPTRWFQLFKEIPKDAWGNNYIYLSPGKKNPTGYDLYSAGKDRKADTADDDWGR
jgi:general secretion pathway protein G